VWLRLKVPTDIYQAAAQPERSGPNKMHLQVWRPNKMHLQVWRHWQEMPLHRHQGVFKFSESSMSR